MIDGGLVVVTFKKQTYYCLRELDRCSIIKFVTQESFFNLVFPKPSMYLFLEGYGMAIER